MNKWFGLNPLPIKKNNVSNHYSSIKISISYYKYNENFKNSYTLCKYIKKN